MKIRLSYHYIVNIGLITLVSLLILMMTLALQQANRSAKAIETITGPHSARQKALNQLVTSTNQAHHLFQLDKTGRLITNADILATLDSLDNKILAIKQKIEQPADLAALNKSTELLVATRAVVQSTISPPQNNALVCKALCSQRQDYISKLQIIFDDRAQVWGNNTIKSPQRLLLLAEAMDLLRLFAAKTTTYVERKNSDPETILLILAHAESSLTELDSAQYTMGGDGPNRHQQVKNLLTLLQLKMPSYYESLQRNSQMPLTNGGQDSLTQTWSQLLTAVSNLKNYEETLLGYQKGRMLEMALQNRSQFFLLACLTIIIVLITSVTMRSILNGRIQELLAGTEKIATGDFKYRLKIMSNDHLGILAKSFNTMADTMASKEAEIFKNLEQLRVSKMQLALSHIELEERVLERTTDLSTANEQLQLMGEVFEHSLEGIIILDMEGKIIKVNPSFTKLTGYAEQEAIGKETSFLETDAHEMLPYELIRKAVAAEGSWDGEVWIRRQDGELFAIWLSLSTMANDSKKTTGYIAIFHDISELKEQANLIQHQALHDPLTELPNRVLLKDRMDVAISHAQRSKEKLAVIFLDLDNFKTINDSLGHDHGDLLLQEAASRLQELVRPGDTVCRMGGDEFVVLVDNLEAKDGLRAVAKRIQNELTSPFNIKGRNLFISASIGMAFFPDDGQDSETLIKHADLAMYQAKKKGKNTIQVFTSSMNKAALERLALEEEIRSAMGSDEFTIHLQPKIKIDTMEVVGMEALARWNHPKRGLVSPATFIPICEEAGLIIPLGLHILEVACHKGMEIITSKPELSLHIAINLSIKQLQSENLLTDIERVMKETGIKAENLEFEITESVLMSDPERTLKVLHTIADMGISIAIDDFGTGYSSLFYLKHFPVSTLKIDKSFIDDLTTDSSSDQIVETIIAMAQRLKLKVVAEGVETEEQLGHLKELGCDIVQGYFFSKPLPCDEIPSFLATFQDQ